jgi:hypothetical protein
MTWLAIAALAAAGTYALRVAEAAAAQPGIG